MSEPMTELVDPDIDVMHLVKNAANGAGVLIAKSAPTPLEVRNALSRAPQSPFGDKAMPKIEAAAKKFGIDADDVKKAGDELAADVPETDDVMEDADTSASARDVLEGQAIDAPGDPDDPGSAAWEAVDAALGRQMVDRLTSLKAMLSQAAAREATEAVSGGDDCDAEQSMDLDDAQAALDFVLSVVAPFAAVEQASADARESRLGMLAKSAVELAAVIKAGRVLSTANEAKLRSAAEAIQSVLATLPAPTEGEEAPVAKSETEQAAEATQPVEKAKGDPQVAVYDANGNLVGTIDAADLNPIQAPEAPKGGDTSGDDGDGADQPDAPADDAAPAPAEAAQAIPGTDTVQAPPAPADDDVAKQSQEVLKSAFADALKETFGEQEAVVKAALERFEERIARMEQAPNDRRSPRLNGADGTGTAARDGQVDRFTELRKQAEAETDPAKRQELAYALIKARFE